jgi:hypothetical protein
MGKTWLVGKVWMKILLIMNWGFFFKFLFSVEYTVPLIRKMESKILVPLKNSPMQ